MLKLRIVFKMFKMCLVSEKGTLITKRDEQLFSRTFYCSGTSCYTSYFENVIF